jgi:hypothetical protein
MLQEDASKQTSLGTTEGNMAAPDRGPLTARHWVLIAAAAVPVVILLVRAVVDRTTRLSDMVAAAMLMFAVRSLLNSRRETTG